MRKDTQGIMKKTKYAIALAALGVLSLGVMGCGKKETSTEATTETTTTEATTAATTEATTEVQHEGVYNDLTGEWVTDRTEEYGRPIAVMLNNISDAMPQCDIGKADIVYEMKVEGGITRLLGIFNDYSNLEKLGSIRSCRPYYVTVAMEYDAIYMHYGQSPQGEEKLSSSGINNLSGLSSEGGVTYYRASDRVSPHNVFTDTEKIKAGIEQKGYETKHSDSFKSVFSFNEEITAPAGGEKAEKITTPISNYTTPWFEYHADDGLYYRFQYGGEQTDGNTGDQLKYENVLIQFAHYTSIDDHDRQQLDLIGEGTGLYASNGVIVPVTWKKSSENAITKYYTEDGNELKLNPGKTWVTVFEKDKADSVTWE